MKLFDSIAQSQDVRRIPFDDPILVAHQPEFMPWLGFISKAAMGDVYLLLDSVQFRKQYFQHRNKIRTRNNDGWQWLIVPLNHESISRTKNISDAKIVNGPWKEEHLRAITQVYSKSPYFASVFSELEDIYRYDGDSLPDFNVRLIKYAFKMFGIDVPVYRTSELISQGYAIEGQKTDIILSMCQAVGAKTFVSGPSGKDYVDRDLFRRKKIKLVFQSFVHPSYSQIHGEFMPCMSFIDLLFNHGPESRQILGTSQWESDQ